MRVRLSSFLLTGLVLSSAVGAYSQTAPAKATQAPIKTLSADQKTALMLKINDRITRVAFVPGADFSTWPQTAEKLKPELDKVTDVDTFAAIINNALSKLGYSHLNVITPEAAEARRTGSKVGIGIYLEIVPQGIKINAVLQDSPAAKAGLQEGDIITLVNGKFPTSAEALAGPEGTVLKVTVLSPNGKTRETSITRGKYQTVLKPSLMFYKDRVGVLKIPTFDKGYDDEATRNYVQAAAEKTDMLIIDLRNNPGGLVLNMQGMAGMFASRDKPLGTMINRSLVKRFVEETKKSPTDLAAINAWAPEKLRPFGSGPIYKGKVAVLINGGTGSAAEMMSAGLRDTIGAKVIGQKSIGMVLASIITPLEFGFQMITPIQDYITISGQRLEGTGVKPDVVVDPPTSQDTVYFDASIKALTPIK